MDNILINVGYVSGFHGLKGELKIKSTSDFIDERLQVNNKLLLVKDNHEIEVTIKSYRKHKDVPMISLVGFNSLNEVELFKGYALKVRQADLYQLEDDEFYHFQLIGLNVVDHNDTNIGTIKRIWDIGANDVFIIDHNGKEILIPYTSNVVEKIDLENKIVKIFDIEGLF
jgi:16S rRNA processing protein RimM